MKIINGDRYDPNWKVIDIEVDDIKEVIDLFLGDCDDYWGDDWDDMPYDCNAGTVYDEYVKGKITLNIPDNILVEELHELWFNARVSRAQQKNRIFPVLILTKFNEGGRRSRNQTGIFLNDNVEDIIRKLKGDF